MSGAAGQSRLYSFFVRQEQARTDALFASIGEGAIAVDDKGQISRVNQAALQILGYQEKDLLGKWYPGTIIAEDKDRNVLNNLDRPITQSFLTGKSVSARLYFRRKNGQRLPVYLTISPILFRGKPIGAIEVFRDISREIALEQAKDDFISIASHQLRTPATGVKQYIGMILEGYAGEVTAKQQTLLNKAYESNERQLEIIDDLLKVARIDAGQVSLHAESVDIIQLLQDIIYEQLVKIKQRSQTIKFSHDEDSLNLLVDPARIRMVFENLIDNASKYTTSGKTIRVEIASLPNQAVITVKDQGIGISKKDVAKLFRKFTRLDHALADGVEGSGLGLYWAKKIIDLHNGSIKVDSEIGQGAVFEVRLPRG